MPRRSPNIKKANAEVEFTYEQIMELKKCAQDPIYFIEKYVMIQHPTDGTVPFELYDYQKDMVQAYKEHRYTVVLSARQTGKEQPHSAKIATPSGWTTMGDIQPGDVVLTPDGNKANVLQKFPQGVKDVYRVEFDDGSHAECGLDHLWDVYIRNKWDSSAANGHGAYVVNRQTLTLREMISYLEKNKNRKNHRNYNIRIPVVSKVDFEEKELPLDPYILGLLLGDGGLSNPSTISFTTKDECLVESIKDAISQHDSIIELRESGNGIDYFITSPESRTNNVISILKELGLMGTKSDTKFIPEIYQTASHEQRLSLLQGLMDTDGTVGKRNNARTISYCTTSTQLRDDVQHLVRGLGGRCSYYTRYPQNPRHKVAYDLYISLPSPRDCFRLERKRDLCHDVWHNNVGHERDIRRTVVGIEKIRQEESSCILIDHPDHLYITDNFTVTHNSTVAAAFLLWYAIFNFDKTILIASRANDHAMEMVMRIRFAYEQLPMWIKPGVQEDGWNKHNIGFDNGSRIISTATSENAGRGFSISLLYLDEFAFVSPTIQDEFWTSISPTLATGGSCIMTSTPNGDMDIFAQIWRGAEVGANGFHPIRVYWDQPPGRDQKFKEDQIAKIGERKWMQEYECEFLSSEALLIKSIVLQNMTPRIEKVRPLHVVNDVVFWHDIKQQGTYLVGVDPATGSGEDYSVITVFEFPSLKQVAEYRSNTMSTNDMYTVLKNILVYLEKKDTMVYFSIENNGVGEGIISLFEADEHPPLNAEFVSEEGKKKRGFTTTSKTKMKACVNLKEMIEKENMEITSPILLKELKMYVRTKGAYAAQPGGTDDCVSAVLIVVRLIEEIATYDQAAFDALYVSQFEQWGEKDWKNYDGYDDYDENDEGLPISIS